VRVISLFTAASIPDVRLRSPLAPSACAARLKAGVDSPWRLFGSKPIIGEVTPVYANLRRRVRWRSLFRACLEVSLLGDGDTVLVCRRGLHPVACLLSSGWFGLLVAIAGLTCVFAVAGGLLERYWPFFLAAPLVCLAVVLAFLLGDGDPASDHAFLIERLALMTEATSV
jgi:hypothetical protein